ncbi:MAG: UDP-N-acetylmuramate--L-alanine ligase [Firmicutes bacterium]|nr:UDP-N-acetylmuramate--L-alanine ligase [Bacillota bacterium]
MDLTPRWAHFIGIGGAGMSGLARVLLELGWRVTGSDLRLSPVTDRLASLGAGIYRGHAPENLGACDLVVVSSAIRPDNPELAAARARGIPVHHRGEMLAGLMNPRKGIAVAGTHGKTTTTAMLGVVLAANGYDPTVLVGGEVPALGGNARVGRGEYVVAEADESDGSFLLLNPHVAVVTNIENDHLDYYGNLAGVAEAFGRFVRGVDPEGAAVLCADDPNVRRILPGVRARVVTYGLLASDADYTLREESLNGAGAAGEVFYRGRSLGKVRLSVPGRHNLANALAVIAAGRLLGLELPAVAGPLAEFRGAGRRFQLLGEVRGVRVVDDYAHHPTEIRATLAAARTTGCRRIVCAFQPHRYTRTKLLAEEFGPALSEADVVVISDVYGAGEPPIEGVTGELIAGSVRRFKPDVVYLPRLEDVSSYMARVARPGDLIITMGAGNIWEAGVVLVRQLEAR